jgi:hypothetical protein
MAIPRPDAVTYERQLETVRDQLASVAEDVGITGTGIARLAWGKKGLRSVSVSWSDEGIYVDYWIDEDELNESFHPTYEEAIEAARKWLAC